MININTKRNRIMANWLFVCCFMVAIMVLIGGLTRLTNSGLSMTDWKPATGILPPLSEEAWQIEFNKYKSSPEYQHINFHFDLEDFKGIFWLEYIHRLAGRITGIVFFIPLLFFIFKNYLSKKLIIRLSIIFLIGACQGVVGWLMVKSGLKDNPHVSPLWLSGHLLTAFLIYSLIFWNALSLISTQNKSNQQRKLSQSHIDTISKWLICIIALLILQITYGGFVAGLDAGLIYNTFPDMNGKLIPNDMLLKTPLAINFYENVTTVQFIHRLLAYIILIAVIALRLKTYNFLLTRSINYAITLLVLTIICQMALGIGTLLMHVPTSLASAHQMGALIILSICLYILHFNKIKPQYL